MASENPSKRLAARPSSRRRRRVLFIGGLSLFLLYGLLVAFFEVAVPRIQYETTHNFPNPYWALLNGAYTYAPDQGPPDSALLDTRPEAVFRQFIAEYIKIAGTYPCMQDLSGEHGMYEPFDDPVIRGGACTVHRPVASVSIGTISVGHYMGLALAEMTADITYVDDSHYVADTAFGAERYRVYWTTKIHLTCWSSVLTSEFYEQYPALIPHGGAYEEETDDPEGILVCP